MTEPHVTALVLAAGASRRMQAPKLLLPVNGRPLIYWCLLAISQTAIADTVIVSGKDYPSLFAYISLLPQARYFNFVINSEYSTGMASSIRTGMHAVADACDAVLLVLADMPFIEARLIGRILQEFVGSGSAEAIVVPTWQGRQGHPVLFGRAYFDELCQLQGDIGARELLAHYRSRIITIAVATPAILIDVDSKEQWQIYNSAKNC